MFLWILLNLIFSLKTDSDVCWCVFLVSFLCWGHTTRNPSQHDNNDLGCWIARPSEAGGVSRCRDKDQPTHTAKRNVGPEWKGVYTPLKVRVRALKALMVGRYCCNCFISFREASFSGAGCLFYSFREGTREGSAAGAGIFQMPLKWKKCLALFVPQKILAPGHLDGQNPWFQHCQSQDLGIHLLRGFQEKKPSSRASHSLCTNSRVLFEGPCFAVARMH